MPDTVAVVGASADRSKFSNKSVRAHAQQGWTVYPVNPKGGEMRRLLRIVLVTGLHRFCLLPSASRC